MQRDLTFARYSMIYWTATRHKGRAVAFDSSFVMAFRSTDLIALKDLAFDCDPLSQENK